MEPRASPDIDPADRHHSIEGTVRSDFHSVTATVYRTAMNIDDSAPRGAARALLRHTIATLAYRAAKVLRDAPANFSSYSIAPGTRTPGQILAHMCDLFDWALSMAQAKQKWADTAPRTWDADCDRFFHSVAAFDQYLESSAPLGTSIEQLFQGPVADALTHTGQLAMLRRLAGAPVKGENYARARIAVGQVGSQQPKAVSEFA